jgi:hypothetical protein
MRYMEPSLRGILFTFGGVLSIPAISSMLPIIGAEAVDLEPE